MTAWQLLEVADEDGAAKPRSQRAGIARPAWWSLTPHFQVCLPLTRVRAHEKEHSFLRRRLFKNIRGHSLILTLPEAVDKSWGKKQALNK